MRVKAYYNTCPCSKDLAITLGKSFRCGSDRARPFHKPLVKPLLVKYLKEIAYIYDPLAKGFTYGFSLHKNSI